MQAISLMIVAAPSRRESIRATLAPIPGLELVGEISEAATFPLIAHLAPAWVVLDGSLAGLNPLLALSSLMAMQPAPQVIYLLATRAPNEQHLARELGARLVLDDPAQLAQVLVPGYLNLDPTHQWLRRAA